MEEQPLQVCFFNLVFYCNILTYKEVVFNLCSKGKVQLLLLRVAPLELTQLREMVCRKKYIFLKAALKTTCLHFVHLVEKLMNQSIIGEAHMSFR